jgi:hypothetical protein
MDLVVPVRNGNATCSFPVRLAHQDADWLDLCPVIRAEVKDPSGSWDVKVSLHGQDVTRELTETGGVNCVGPLRLWSGQAHDLQVTLSGRPEARVPNGPVEVKFTAITHSSEPDRVSDTFTVRATAATAESGVASR